MFVGSLRSARHFQVHTYVYVYTFGHEASGKLCFLPFLPKNLLYFLDFPNRKKCPSENSLIGNPPQMDFPNWEASP